MQFILVIMDEGQNAFQVFPLVIFLWRSFLPWYDICQYWGEVVSGARISILVTHATQCIGRVKVNVSKRECIYSRQLSPFPGPNSSMDSPYPTDVT